MIFTLQDWAGVRRLLKPPTPKITPKTKVVVRQEPEPASQPPAEPAGDWLVLDGVTGAVVSQDMEGMRVPPIPLADKSPSGQNVHSEDADPEVAAALEQAERELKEMEAQVGENPQNVGGTRIPADKPPVLKMSTGENSHNLGGTRIPSEPSLDDLRAALIAKFDDAYSRLDVRLDEEPFGWASLARPELVRAVEAAEAAVLAAI
ncbi:hypothetical protein, partial [Thermodesulfitimonas autotrophica]|uniref:hypothetical protein n=1 Tax=Thermodesulfitimonas autotrophica TaxID=1894989 RepID=UPI002FE381E2